MRSIPNDLIYYLLMAATVENGVKSGVRDTPRRDARSQRWISRYGAGSELEFELRSCIRGAAELDLLLDFELRSWIRAGFRAAELDPTDAILLASTSPRTCDLGS